MNNTLINTYIYRYIYIYPGTIMLSDAKVKRQVYKLALFWRGGGSTLCCRLTYYNYFKSIKVKRQNVTKVKRHMNLCGTNRFVPRKNSKIEKELFNLYLRNFTIFSKERGSHRFSAGASGSARDKQFSAGNRFMPRFLIFSINYHSNRKS